MKPMIRLGSAVENPNVRFIISEEKVINILTDMGPPGKEILTVISREVNRPDKPAKIMCIYFSWSIKAKQILLVLANKTPLPLNIPGAKLPLGCIMVMEASSPLTLLSLFDDCIKKDKDSSNKVYYTDCKNYIRHCCYRNSIEII